MLFELLLDLFQPVIELLRLGVQPDKFCHQYRQFCCAQGFCGICGCRRGQALHTAQRAVVEHCIILGYQSATASTGKIKLLRTLLTQASTILRADCSTYWCTAFSTILSRFVHDSPPDALRDFCCGSPCLPHPAHCCLNMIPYLFRLVSNGIVPAPILPLGIDGSHPALRSLSLDVGQGIVAFGFQDEMYIRLALQAYDKIRLQSLQMPSATPPIIAGRGSRAPCRAGPAERARNESHRVRPSSS